MSVRTAVYLSTGIIVLLIMTIGFGGYLMILIQEQSKNNGKMISNFFDRYNKTVLPIIVELNQAERGRTELLNVSIDNQHLILSTLNQSQLNGNTTVAAFQMLIEQLQEQGNATLSNQEVYFKPYLNESFNKIYRALNITD
jgi:hypothetical protein